MIGLKATDVTGLFQEEVRVINFTTEENIDSWNTVHYSSSSVGGHYDSLFIECPGSVIATWYGRVVKPVHRKGTIYY